MDDTETYFGDLALEMRYGFLNRKRGGTGIGAVRARRLADLIAEQKSLMAPAVEAVASGQGTANAGQPASA